MEDRASFKFFRSYFEAAKDIPDRETRADFLMAVCEYALDGTEPETSGVASALFRLVRPNLDKSNNLADNGKKGGEQTPNKPEADAKQTESKPEANCKQTGSKCEANAKQTPSKPEADAKQTGTGRRKKEEGVKDIGDKDVGDSPPIVPPSGDAFEAFWAAYPKKVGKQSAKKAFEKVKVPLETLVSAVRRQECSSQWSRDGGQYIPNAATWLNQGRWEDELPGGGDTHGAAGGDHAKVWGQYGINL